MVISQTSVISKTSSLFFDLKAKIGVSLNLHSLLDSSSIYSTGTHAYQLRLLARGGVIDESLGTWTPDLITGGNSSTLPRQDFYSSLLDPLLSLTDARVLFQTDFTKDSLALFFGGAQPNSGTIDDLRVIRNDMQSSYKLRLLLRPNDTSPKLDHGLWSFVVWVLVPPGRSFVTEAASAANPYATSTVTLSMDEIAAPTAGFLKEFSLDASARSTWQRLELKMVNDNYSFDATSTAPVIELAVWPTSKANPDPGGVLIAQPELHVFLSGYVTAK